jgi:hypothetical protein
MKTILLIILLTSTCYSQITLDSNQAKTLRLYIDTCQTVKENYQSALRELTASDSALVKQFEIIQGYKIIEFNNNQTINELRVQVQQLTNSGAKWYWYVGGSVLIYLLGVLTVLAVR